MLANEVLTYMKLRGNLYSFSSAFANVLQGLILWSDRRRTSFICLFTCQYVDSRAVADVRSINSKFAEYP